METLRNFFSKTDDPRNLACFSAADVAKILTPEVCLEALTGAYKNLAEDPESEPKTLGFKGEGCSFHIKAGFLPKTKATFAAKLNANFPSNPARGLPTIQGILVLFDATNGIPLAVMDSGELTAIRTAATAALGATFGAKRESKTITFVGTGFQAGYFYQAFAALFPIRDSFAYDLDENRARAFSKKFNSKPVRDLKTATLISDIIVTSTTSKKPVLLAEMVTPGAFVAAMGADNKEKNEIDPKLFKDAVVLVDDLEKCAGEGDLQQAIEGGFTTASKVGADLAQLVSGKKHGRSNPREIVIFDSVGNGLQDVAAAGAVYFAGKSP